MLIIPAIDILGGRCVRLVKGEYGTASKVAEDAVETAKRFEAAGARYIHIVDLDGAKEGRPVNYRLICEIARSVSVPVEVGGGIRGEGAVDYYVQSGVKRVILGSAALNDVAMLRICVNRFKDKISVGIDAKSDYVRTSGWTVGSQTLYTELAVKMADMGVKNIIFTDIDRDGTLSGPPLEKLGRLIEAVEGKTLITASGGVGRLADITALAELDVYAAIVGKAIYTGGVDLAEAIKAGKA